MPTTSWMSRAQRCPGKPSATVVAFLLLLGTQECRRGAISRTERPPIHLSSQNRARWPLPIVMVVEARKSARSSGANCRSRPFQALLAAPFGPSISRTPPRPAHSSSRALQPHPWPQPSRWPSPKSSTAEPPPVHIWVYLHPHSPIGAPPRSGYSSRRPRCRAHHHRRPRPPRSAFSLTWSSPACV